MLTPSRSTLPLINADSGPDNQRLRHCYNWQVMSQQASIKEKQPHQTICVKHNVRLWKIDATCRWLSTTSVTSYRYIRCSARIVHTGVPEGSKLSPSPLTFKLADIPPPTEPVKRICYADDITVWASGVKIPELEHKDNTYLMEISRFLRVNSLLIAAPKSSVTLFMPDPAEANTHQKLKIADSEVPLVCNPKILGVNLDTFYSFKTHCVQVVNQASQGNNVLKALTGTNWGQQNETLLMAYKYIANCATLVWGTNASESNMDKI